MARPQAYMTAVELLVELASLQTAFLTLDEAIKTTNRRVNALDNVVIPKLENTIAYIKARAPRRAAAASLPRPCLLAGRLSSAELCAACKRRLDTYQAPSGYLALRLGLGAAMCIPGQADVDPAVSPCAKPGCSARATSPCQGPPWGRRPASCSAARAPARQPRRGAWPGL